MEDLKIVVIGEPVTQLRPRFNKSTGAAVDPKKCKDYKRLVGKTAKEYVGKDWTPYDDYIRIELDFFRGVPKSWSKKRKELAYQGKILPGTTPDIDNLYKCFTDGCSKVVWKDDNIIVEAKMRKFYSKVPRAELRVFKVESNL